MNLNELQNPRLCVLGKPGSGKGTISTLLLEKFSFPVNYYNVGRILRGRSDKDEHIKQVHSSGGLVDTNRVLSIFDEALNEDNFILDGSPRRPEEAEYILHHQAWKRKPGILIHLKVDDNLAQQRLLERNRFDDTLDVIEKRLSDFNEITMKSIERFAEANYLLEIDASESPEKVTESLFYELTRLKREE